jgi:hypothetical protein
MTQTKKGNLSGQAPGEPATTPHMGNGLLVKEQPNESETKKRNEEVSATRARASGAGGGTVDVWQRGYLLSTCFPGN